MIIATADFVASYPTVSACPKEALPEFAFIGRSNVGKSSLLNMLTGRKSLAKVSGTPGKTQLLNYFHINKKWYLVDLPGYGYARLSKVKIKELSNMINGYFINRKSLTLAFVLIDSNIPPSKIDLAFIQQLGEWEVPFALVFTKSDRSGKMTTEKNIAAMMAILSETWEVLPQYFLTSSEKRTGREEVLDFIEKMMKKR
jgi:GTP-binding protein